MDVFSKHLFIFRTISTNPKNYADRHRCQLKAARINSDIIIHLNEPEAKGAQLPSEVENTDFSSSLPPLPSFAPLSLQFSIFYSSLSERDLSAIMWLTGSDETAKM